MKLLRDFAQRTGQMDLFNQGDAAGIQTLQNQMDVQKGDAFAFQDGRVIPSELYGKIDSDSKDFKTASKFYRSAYEGYARLLESLSFDGGIADIGTVFSFMKSLDPNSVVRESEFDLPTNAGGIYAKMQAVEDRYKKGELLPDQVKQEIYELSSEIMNSYTSSYHALYDDYARKAKNLNFTDNDVQTFFGQRMTLPQPPARGMFLQQLGPIRSDMNEPVDLTPDLDDLVNSALSPGGAN